MQFGVSWTDLALWENRTGIVVTAAMITIITAVLTFLPYLTISQNGTVPLRL
jgi:hypothetical protein